MKTLMRVPYYDLKVQYAALRDEILEALDRVCRNTAFCLGNEVAAFEKEFSAYCEAKHCIAVNSGTSALHLSLLAAGVGAGDEVITSPNTFIATAEAIAYTGAKTVFADVDPRTGNLDPRSVEGRITPRTKALLPIHLYGRPGDMDALREIARSHKLALIEDACQAHGARYRGRRAGTLGDSAAFSFYPSKNLGAYGEGGALLTNDARIAEFARAARTHGETSRYIHDFIGYNYRMEGFQAAVLRVKLHYLDEWSARRRAIAARYRQQLSGARVDLPQDDPRDENAWHLFVVYVDHRDRVQGQLDERGIGTAVHYPHPLHLQKALAHLGYRAGDFPHAERACQRVLSLPFFPELTEEQVDYVAESLQEIAGRR
ncbi:MAG TPA: DegT/DnrJ/EryC1/StrS family aminotransferase [Candidatus Acidoferrales bacterium]|nr:DegT/DnrJ/EryC1/StrS family aminotransferase [Candidatus Acidoferrales bacterium]